MKQNLRNATMVWDINISLEISSDILVQTNAYVIFRHWSILKNIKRDCRKIKLDLKNWHVLLKTKIHCFAVSKFTHNSDNRKRMFLTLIFLLNFFWSLVIFLSFTYPNFLPLPTPALSPEFLIFIYFVLISLNVCL